MMNSRYQDGCANGSQEHGKTAVWCVNFNNGDVNNNNRNNKACVLAVRSSEYHGVGIVQLKEIFEAWKKARAGKKPSKNQMAFDAHWADGLLGIQKRINDCSWEPGRSACFIATKPKAREIHAPDFADRVVHHWLVPQLEKIWEPLFIFDSYANRKGKGSHAAVKRLQSFVREVHSGQGGGFYLQLDIQNFFNSIHRPTLWAMIKNKLLAVGVSEQVLRATHALLRRSPLQAGVIMHGTVEEIARVPPHKRLENSAPGYGLPIGNLSSQFFANVYLDRLDQFVKHTLKAARYIRYVDDFVLTHKDREQLVKWQQQIEQFIAAELKLRLKDDIRLKPLSDGIDFLGYVVRPTHTLVRRRVVASARSALSDWEQNHIAGDSIKATPEGFRELKAKLASYEGHFQHANSHRLRASISKRFKWLKTAKRKRKFDYRLEGKQIEIKVK